MSETPSNVFESLPPVGTLLIILNQFAESLNLSADCDDYLRSDVPVDAAFEIITEVTHCVGSHPPADWNEYIMSSFSNDRQEKRSLYAGGTLSGMLLTRNYTPESVSEAAIRSSIVQILQLIDEFCNMFGVNSLGEKELKYAVPCDAAVHLLACLAFDPSFARCERKDWIIVGRCRRIRHERKIDVARDPWASLIPVNRTLSLNSDLHSKSSRMDIEAQSFSETFPLHADSVLKHSGPKLVLVLSLAAVNGLVTRWLQQYPKVDSTRFWTEYPFDCLVRGIKGFPNSLEQAEWLIRESMKTKARFRSCSLDELSRKVDDVCSGNSLSSEIRNFLRQNMSITYCYLVVFKQIDKRDSKALSKAGKWISLGRLRIFEMRDVTPPASSPEFIDI